jgi:putative PIN family toxin of toxin-antitoxin system
MARASWWARAADFLKGRSSRRPAEEAPEIERGPGVRIVVDTNVLIAAVRTPDSSSRRLLDAVAEGRATLLVSPPVFEEYRRILPRAVRSDERERILRAWIARGEPVNAGRGERAVPDDADDDKFVELARAGKADAIVSSDEHLLGAGGKLNVTVLRPGEAVRYIELRQA